MTTASESKSMTAAEEEKEDSKSFRQAVYEFANDTNFHGVKYIAVSTRWFTRIGWLLLVLGMTGVLIYQIYDRTTHYFSWPVTSDISVGKPDRDISFPMVTICNTNTFRLSEVEEANLFQQISSHYTDQNSLSDDLEDMSSELNNYTFRYLIEKFGHKMDDSIKSASFQSDPLTLDNFTSIITDYGMCFAFNQNPKREINAAGTGIAYGLQVLVNLEIYESMDGARKSSGLRVLIHDKTEIPRVKDLGISIPASMTALIGVTAKQTTELEDPYGPCEPNREPVATCLRKAHLQMVTDICSCKPFYSYDSLPPKDLRYCTLSEHRDCIDPNMQEIREEHVDESRCAPPCNKMSYDTYISYSSLSSYTARSMAKSVNTSSEEGRRMLDDYVKSRNALHRVNGEMADEDFKIVDQFVNSLQSYGRKVLDLVEFVEKRYATAYDQYVAVNETLSEISKQLTRSRRNYVKMSSISRVETMVLTPLAQFRHALDNYLRDDITAMGEFLLNGNGEANQYKRQADGVQTIFRNVAVSVLDGMAEFKIVFTRLNAELQNNDGGDPQRRFPSSELKALLPKIEVALAIFNKTSQAFVDKAFDVSDAVWLFDGQRISDKSVWRAFESNINDVMAMIDTVEGAAASLFGRLDSVLAEVTDVIAITSNHEVSLEFAYNRYMIALFGSNFIGIRKRTEDVDDYVTKPLADFVNNAPKNSISQLSLVAYDLYTLTDLKYTIDELLGSELPRLVDTVTGLSRYASSAADYLKKFATIFPDLETNVTRVIDILKASKKDGAALVKLVDDLKKFQRSVLTSEGAFSKHMNEFQESIEINEKFIKDNYVYVNVFFRSLDVEKLTKSKAYTWFSLVCDVGGTAGLYLGASLLAIAEVIYFLGGEILRGFSRIGKKGNASSDRKNQAATSATDDIHLELNHTRYT
ncbi:degenerin-like protein del-10 [Tubulanus polymorphus]|uniref:degenerin-like protein del-10 n=1 Tax=Tubulanus polymorphus TaxID=672921 RepID=UPI003DA2F5B6